MDRDGKQKIKRICLSEGSALARLVERIDPEDLRKQRPDDFPAHVYPHLNSHHNLTDHTHSLGFLSDEVARLMHIFIECHDLAYSPTAFDLDRDKDPFIELMTVNAMLGLSRVREQKARKIAEQLYSILILPESRGNPLIVPIIIHGTASIIPGISRLKEFGLTHEQALGLTTIFSAHHPGFPIEMVNYLPYGPHFPPEFCAALLIDTGRGAEQNMLMKSMVASNRKERHTLNTLAQVVRSKYGPNFFRRQLAKRGAELLGIEEKEAEKIASLGFILDRITPGRRTKGIQLDEIGRVVRNKYGGFAISDGEVIEKKNRLVVTNVPDMKKMTLSEIFNRTVTDIQTERDAAYRSAKYFSTPEDNALELIVEHVGGEAILDTQRMQHKALAAAEKVEGFSGHFNNLKSDRDLLIKEYQLKGEELNETNRSSLRYAIAVLEAIECDPMAQSALRKVDEQEKKRASANINRDSAIIELLAVVASIQNEGGNRQIRRIVGAAFETVRILPGEQNLVSVEVFQPGETIIKDFERGGYNDSIFTLVSGVVRVEKNGVVLSHQASPFMFGEISLLNGSRPTVDIIAEKSVKLLKIQTSRLSDIFQDPYLSVVHGNAVMERLSRFRNIVEEETGQALAELVSLVTRLTDDGEDHIETLQKLMKLQTQRSELFKLIECQPGEVILEAENDADEVYFVVDGSAISTEKGVSREIKAGYLLGQGSQDDDFVGPELKAGDEGAALMTVPQALFLRLPDELYGSIQRQ